MILRMPFSYHLLYVCEIHVTVRTVYGYNLYKGLHFWASMRELPEWPGPSTMAPTDTPTQVPFTK